MVIMHADLDSEEKLSLHPRASQPVLFKKSPKLFKVLVL